MWTGHNRHSKLSILHVIISWKAFHRFGFRVMVSGFWTFKVPVGIKWFYKCTPLKMSNLHVLLSQILTMSPYWLDVVLIICLIISCVVYAKLLLHYIMLSPILRWLWLCGFGSSTSSLLICSDVSAPWLTHTKKWTCHLWFNFSVWWNNKMYVFATFLLNFSMLSCHFLHEIGHWCVCHI